MNMLIRNDETVDERWELILQHVSSYQKASKHNKLTNKECTTKRVTLRMPRGGFKFFLTVCSIQFFF